MKERDYMNIKNGVKNKFNNPFVSLKQKNFRYYWLGMCVSLIGTWMQNIAQPWLAYTLTKSAFFIKLNWNNAIYASVNIFIICRSCCG